MATTLQLKRGNTADVEGMVGATGELIVDTDNKTINIMDAITLGGTPLLKTKRSPIEYEVKRNNALHVHNGAICDTSGLPIRDIGYFVYGMSSYPARQYGRVAVGDFLSAGRHDEEIFMDIDRVASRGYKHIRTAGIPCQAPDEAYPLATDDVAMKEQWYKMHFEILDYAYDKGVSLMIDLLWWPWCWPIAYNTQHGYVDEATMTIKPEFESVALNAVDIAIPGTPSYIAYWDMVTEYVQRVGAHPAVSSWETSNELNRLFGDGIQTMIPIIYDPNYVPDGSVNDVIYSRQFRGWMSEYDPAKWGLDLNWMHAINAKSVAVVREHDPQKHMIGPGFCGPTFGPSRDYYMEDWADDIVRDTQLGNFDFSSAHVYDEQSAGNRGGYQKRDQFIKLRNKLGDVPFVSSDISNNIHWSKGGTIEVPGYIEASGYGYGDGTSMYRAFEQVNAMHQSGLQLAYWWNWGYVADGWPYWGLHTHPDNKWYNGDWQEKTLRQYRELLLMNDYNDQPITESAIKPAVVNKAAVCTNTTTSVRFDSSVADALQLNDNDGVSISFWIKTTPESMVGEQHIMNHCSPLTGWYVYLVDGVLVFSTIWTDSNGTKQFFSMNNEVPISPEDGWTQVHIQLTSATIRDADNHSLADTITFYRNGRQIAHAGAPTNLTQTYTAPAATELRFFGARNNDTQGFTGSLADVRFYTRMLSDRDANDVHVYDAPLKHNPWDLRQPRAVKAHWDFANGDFTEKLNGYTPTSVKGTLAYDDSYIRPQFRI